MAGGIKAWEIFGVIGLDGLSQAGRSLDVFDRAGQAVGMNLLKLNGAALLAAGSLAAVGLAAAGVGVAGVAAFIPFDDAMVKSTAIMEDLSDTMRGELSRTAREMALTTQFSATQAAEAYLFLASAGLTAEQSIAALPQVTAFATAGNFSLARATELATDAQSALGLKSSDAQRNLAGLARVTDVLTHAANLSNASTEQFAESLTTKSGPALRTFGKELEEGVAVLAVMADQGIKGANSGEALARIMLLMTASARDAAEEHKKLGVSVYDSSGNMRNFADIIENLEQVLEGMSDEEKAATLETLGFEARIQSAILPLIGLSKEIRRYEAELRSAGGVTQEVAEKQLKSFRAELDLLKNEFVDIGISIGESLAPALRESASAFHEWVRDIRGAVRSASHEIENSWFGRVRQWAGEVDEVLKGIEWGDLLKPAPASIQRASVNGQVFGDRTRETASMGPLMGRTDAEHAYRTEGERRMEAARRAAEMAGMGPNVSAPPKPPGPTEEEVAKALSAAQRLSAAKRELALDEIRFMEETEVRRLELTLDFLRRDLAASKAGSVERIGLQREVMQAEAELIDAKFQVEEDRLARDKARREASNRLIEEQVQHEIQLGRMSIEERMAQLQTLLANERLVAGERMSLETELFRLASELQSRKVEAARSTTGATKEQITAALEQVRVEMAAFYEQFPELEQRFVEQTRETVSKGVKAVEPFEDDMRQAGQNLVRGLIQGNQDMGQLLKDTIISLMMTAIMGPIGSLFKFGSPSKVTAGYGRDIIRGLITGMESQYGPLQATSMQAALIARNALVPAGMTVSPFGGMTPTASMPTAPPGGPGTRELTIRFPDKIPITPPANPIEAARDQHWQDLFRETALVAKDGGFKV